jgi:hypothetical protein
VLTFFLTNNQAHSCCSPGQHHHSEIVRLNHLLQTVGREAILENSVNIAMMYGYAINLFIPPPSSCCLRPCSAHSTCIPSVLSVDHNRCLGQCPYDRTLISAPSFAQQFHHHSGGHCTRYQGQFRPLDVVFQGTYVLTETMLNFFNVSTQFVNGKIDDL